MLHRRPEFLDRFANVNVRIPRTLVLATDEFEAFVEINGLADLSRGDQGNDEVAKRFLEGRFSQSLRRQLEMYLEQVTYPLAVRSSGLMEDAQFCAYAGLYRTFMLPNNGPDLECRLEQMVRAIKLVFASAYFQEPKAFSRRMGLRPEDEKMAVMIQRLEGSVYDGYFYPAISGVAQSHNYYPFGPMMPEDGVATVALGLGRAVMEGKRNLRFCPRYPEVLPQRNTVEETLDNSQRYFYALSMGGDDCILDLDEAGTLDRREVYDAAREFPVRAVSGAYLPDEQRIVDSMQPGGHPVVTFAPVLKHGLLPLPELLTSVLELGTRGMGTPVEIEFSVDIGPEGKQTPEFSLLQIRPMSARVELRCVEIADEEVKKAFCVSHKALGNTMDQDMADIVFV
ncbi:MAG: PEP/pyruvate-binding domain-containing protein [Desulfatibacillaceae bacterium]